MLPPMTISGLNPSFLSGASINGEAKSTPIYSPVACRPLIAADSPFVSVDTYDTLRSGMPNAIRVAKEFGDRINFIGIRLDSGDLAYLSKKARKMLDEAGFTDAKVIASSDLDEHTIMNLKAQGARIDVWGVGTKLITAYDQPALAQFINLLPSKKTGKWSTRSKFRPILKK